MGDTGMLELEPLRKALDRYRREPDVVAGSADREESQPALPRRRHHHFRMLVIGCDHRSPVRLDQLGEQPQLGIKIGLRARMIVEMVAAEIGEGSSCHPDAVEPTLIEPVRRGFNGEMSHAFAGELSKRAMQRHRVRSGERVVDLARRRDEPDGADARRRLAQGGPDLAGESGDRRLAAGAGHRRDGFRLAREEFRRRQRQCPARIADLDEGNPIGQRHRWVPFGHDRRGPGRDRPADEPQAVVARAGERDEQIARSDGATVGANAREIERGEARIADGIHGE